MLKGGRIFMVLCGMVINSAMTARAGVVPLFPHQIGDLHLLSEYDSDISAVSPTVWRRLRAGPLPSLADMLERTRRRRAEPAPDGGGLLQAAPFSVVYTYDFPGNPTGSGKAADQSSTAPAFTTFGDWTRVNLQAGTTPNVWDNDFWNTTSTINRTQYTSFTITANSGFFLNLQSITFDESRTGGGPTKGEVQLFTNGVLYATFDYNPSLVTGAEQFKNFSFNFTPTTAADQVTSAEFRFIAWNTGNSSSSLIFDNVAVTLDVVPEWNAGRVSALFAAAHCRAFAHPENVVKVGAGHRTIRSPR